VTWPFIPGWLDDRKMDLHLFRYLCRVLRRTGQAGEFWESPQTTAQEFGWAAHHVRKVRARLEAAGVLICILKGRRGRGHSARYRIAPIGGWRLDLLGETVRRGSFGNPSAARGAGDKCSGTGREDGPLRTKQMVSRGPRSYSLEVTPRKELSAGTPFGFSPTNGTNGHGNGAKKHVGGQRLPSEVSPGEMVIPEADHDAADLWNPVVDRLRARVPGELWATWLRGVVPIGVSEQGLLLWVPSEQNRQWLYRNSSAREALQGIGAKVVVSGEERGAA
jgi:hypothetical protein